MNKQLFYAIALAIALVLSVVTVAQEQGNPMEEWMKVSQPGPHHKHLHALVGHWHGESQMFNMPGSPKSKGTSVKTMVFGGRFLNEMYTGNFMGKTFQGSGVTGYDNVTKQYQSVWADSIATCIMTFTGSCSKDGKVFTFHGQYTEPTGEQVKTRYTLEIVSEDEHVMTMYDTKKDGKEIKSFQLVYTRVKANSGDAGK